MWRQALQLSALLLLILTFVTSTQDPSSPRRFHAREPALQKNIVSKTRETSLNNIMDSNPQTSSEQTEKVCIVGSGNWGSAIATLVGRNCRILANCDDEVNMWVYEEMVEAEDGSMQKLTDVINTEHENIKYLPGIRLPKNVKAVPDLKEACDGATLLIFVLPHQFLPRLLPTIREAAHPSCRGVSLIKGLGKKTSLSHSLLST